MIVFNLGCDKDHRFEGWFASAEAFDQQRERGQVNCPVCGSATVSRLPSAPYVVTRHQERPAGAVDTATTASAPTPAPAPAMNWLNCTYELVLQMSAKGPAAEVECQTW